jgi:very-short-patch-repair endonuclease
MKTINNEIIISIKNLLSKIAKEIQLNNNDLFHQILNILDEIDDMFSDDNYTWPMSINKFCRNFDLNKGTVMTHKRNYLIRGDDFFVEGSGPTKTLCLNKCGALKILEHSKSEKGVKYKNKHGIHITPKDEHYYINIIKSALFGLDILKKEFIVKVENKSYRIDLYLQNAKLAIECDENDHYGQEYSKELVKRESIIVKELGCRFLRFNPNEPGFNVGEIINVIYHYISNKLINEKDAISYYQEKRQRSIRKGICVAKVSIELDLTDMPD